MSCSMVTNVIKNKIAICDECNKRRKMTNPNLAQYAITPVDKLSESEANVKHACYLNQHLSRVIADLRRETSKRIFFLTVLDGEI